MELRVSPYLLLLPRASLAPLLHAPSLPSLPLSLSLEYAPSKASPVPAPGPATGSAAAGFAGSEGLLLPLLSIFRFLVMTTATFAGTAAGTAVIVLCVLIESGAVVWVSWSFREAPPLLLLLLLLVVVVVLVPAYSSCSSLRFLAVKAASASSSLRV